MRNQQTSLILAASFMTACSTNCGQSQGCPYKWNGPGETVEQPQPSAPTQGSQSLPQVDTSGSERDTLAFVTTDAGTFAVASVPPADEVRIYRVDASDLDEDPLTVRLVGKMGFDAGASPGRVIADDHGHALVKLGRDGAVVTIDPLTATRVGAPSEPVRSSAPDALITLGDTSAYVDDGDAYLLTGNAADFSRVGGPGMTRAVALGDIPGEYVTRHVFAMQTVTPRMLVFFLVSDTTMPVAFEPLE